MGVGWNEDEATNHGVDFRRRRALVREQILAMQRLWSDEVASFEGELVHLPPSWGLAQAGAAPASPHPYRRRPFAVPLRAHRRVRRRLAAHRGRGRGSGGAGPPPRLRARRA
ncbi:LLM class flavin-dependent oxidoreductase [Sorangium sp. So ce1099]|uniref:LLM class flavin-dependent oxidoreductase n=1 Tax=Sorangium sp. So ce1099 TaxID=3133331 RepID=UPI003F5DB5A4